MEECRDLKSQHGLGALTNREREPEATPLVLGGFGTYWQSQPTVEQTQAAKANCLWVFPLASLLTTEWMPETYPDAV